MIHIRFVVMSQHNYAEFQKKTSKFEIYMKNEPKATKNDKIVRALQITPPD